MFEGNANVISTGPTRGKASVLQVFFEISEEGIDDNDKDGPREKATLKNPRKKFDNGIFGSTEVKHSSSFMVYSLEESQKMIWYFSMLED